MKFDAKCFDDYRNNWKCNPNSTNFRNGFKCLCFISWMPYF